MCYYHFLGLYIYANGDQYEGEYENNLKESSGVYICAKGGKYEGEFAQGRKNGQGIYEFKNGD